MYQLPQVLSTSNLNFHCNVHNLPAQSLVACSSAKGSLLKCLQCMCFDKDIPQGTNYPLDCILKQQQPIVYGEDKLKHVYFEQKQLFHQTFSSETYCKLERLKVTDCFKNLKEEINQKIDAAEKKALIKIDEIERKGNQLIEIININTSSKELSEILQNYHYDAKVLDDQLRQYLRKKETEGSEILKDLINRLRQFIGQETQFNPNRVELAKTKFINNLEPITFYEGNKLQLELLQLSKDGVYQPVNYNISPEGNKILNFQNLGQINIHSNFILDSKTKYILRAKIGQNSFQQYSGTSILGLVKENINGSQIVRKYDFNLHNQTKINKINQSPQIPQQQSLNWNQQSQSQLQFKICQDIRCQRLYQVNFFICIEKRQFISHNSNQSQNNFRISEQFINPNDLFRLEISLDNQSNLIEIEAFYEVQSFGIEFY